MVKFSRARSRQKNSFPVALSCFWCHLVASDLPPPRKTAGQVSQQDGRRFSLSPGARDGVRASLPASLSSLSSAECPHSDPATRAALVLFWLGQGEGERWCHSFSSRVRALCRLRFSPPRRVPHGVTLIGRLFDEGTIGRAGLALERAFGVVGERPPGF